MLNKRLTNDQALEMGRFVLAAADIAGALGDREPSAEAALEILLPKLGLTGAHSFSTHTFQGKLDLMQKLPNRLVGYSRWLLNVYFSTEYPT